MAHDVSLDTKDTCSAAGADRVVQHFPNNFRVVVVPVVLCAQGQSP